MGETNFALLSTSIYGTTLLMSAIAFYILQRLIISSQGSHSLLKKALGRDLKGKLSVVFYLCGILFGLLNSYVAIVFYIVVAIMWIIPDTRIEHLADKEEIQSKK